MSTYNIKNKEILKQCAGNMPYRLSIPTHTWNAGCTLVKCSEDSYTSNNKVSAPYLLSKQGQLKALQLTTSDPNTVVRIDHQTG